MCSTFTLAYRWDKSLFYTEVLKISCNLLSTVLKMGLPSDASDKEPARQ